VNAQALVFGATEDRVEDVADAGWEVLLESGSWIVVLRKMDEGGEKEVRKMQYIHEEHQESVMEVPVV